MVHPDDVALKRHALEEMMRTGEPCEYEFRLLGDDGTYRWYQARTDALHDGRGYGRSMLWASVGYRYT